MENKKKISFITILMYILIASLSIYILYALTTSSLANRNNAYLKNEVTNQYELYRTEYNKKDETNKEKVKQEKEKFLKMYTRAQALEIDLTPAYTLNTLEEKIIVEKQVEVEVEKDGNKVKEIQTVKEEVPAEIKVIVEFYQVRSINNNKEGKKTRGILIFTDTYNFKNTTNVQFNNDAFGTVHDYNGSEGLIIALYNKEKTISQVQNLLQPQSPFIIQDIENIQNIDITSATLHTFDNNNGNKTLKDPGKWYLTVPRKEFAGYSGELKDAEGNQTTVKKAVNEINTPKTEFKVYENYNKDLNNHNTNVILTVTAGVLIVLIINYFMIAHKYVKPLIMKKFGKDKGNKKDETVSEKEEQTVVDADFKDIDKK